MLRSLLLSLALAALPAAAQPAPRPADLIVKNARIYTADDTRPRAEAMAVGQGRVLFVGSERGALALKGPATRVVDLGGQTVVPGLIDAHAHLAGLGALLAHVDLTGTRSYEEVVRRVAERARTTPKGQWIEGRGWDQNDWSDKRFPTHEALSRAVPDHPVVLGRVDGHAVLANARAMQLAGVTAATKDTEGGRILRGPDGAPTGVFVDNAEALVNGKIPAPSPAEARAALLAAVKEAQKWGLTGVHDAGAGKGTLELYEALAREGALGLRVYAMVADQPDALEYAFGRGPRSGLGDGRLWVRSIKMYMDGALGSRGAALLAPYSDDPHNTGLILTDPRHVEEVSVRALKEGFQVCTHAIGDRGNRVALDAYARALHQAPVADHRFRIEHAQVVAPEDLPRFAELDVLPSMQATHQTSDMYWAGKRVGEKRLAGAYAWRSLLDTGVVVPNGTDFPVEQVSPLLTFHAAVTRQDAKNWPRGGWRADQRMTRDEALKSMTLWAAYAGFMEQEVGSLTPGKRADFVVLDQDLMRAPAEQLLRTHVLSTWLDGKPVYEATAAQPSSR